jgi:hypothetical protein
VIAVPVVTPHHRRSLPRLSRVLTDSGARHLLTTQATLSRRRELLEDLPDQPHWLTIESLELAGAFWAPVSNNDEIALDQLEGVLIGETKKIGDNTVILRLPFDAQVQELVDLLKIGMLNDLKMIIATKEG